MNLWKSDVWKCMARLVLISCAMFASMHSFGQKTVEPQAESGTIDLTNWNFNENGSLDLNGQWEFYWKQLLEPNDFGNDSTLQKKYFELPSIWNGHEINGEKLSGIGYATYRLVIKNVGIHALLRLNIPAYYSNYKLWINGELTSKNGQVGAIKNQSIPKWLPTSKPFVVGSEKTIEIIIQVSNFHHSKGGIYKSPILGLDQDLSKRRELDVAMDFMLAGVLFISGLFFLGLFFFWRKNISLLYFSLFSLFVGYYFVASGTYILVYLFESFSWGLSVRLEYISLYAGSLFFFSFTHVIFPKSNSTLVIRSLQVITTVLIILVFFTSPLFFTSFADFFQYVLIFYMLYAIVVAIISIINREFGSAYAVVGMVFLFIAIFAGSLDYLGLLKTIPFLIEFAFIGFVLSQSFILSYRFATAFKNEESLNAKNLKQSEELQKSNESIFVKNTALRRQKKEIELQRDKISENQKIIEEQNEKLKNYTTELEEKVSERTQQLQTSLTKTELVNQELDMFIYRSAHNLRAPVVNMLGLCKLGLIDGKTNYKQYFNQLKETVDQMDGMLFHLQRANTLKNHKLGITNIKLQAFIDEIIASMQVPQDCKVNNNIGKDDCWESDPFFLDVLIRNLLENAVKFSKKDKNTINIDINSLEESSQEMVMLIKDQGQGVKDSVKDKIFDMFYRGIDKPGFGLGLYEAKIILRRLQGTVQLLKSKKNETIFEIRIPNFVEEQ